jgi:sigma-B regulation protein RsbU (phosphoserine phosphatase)
MNPVENTLSEIPLFSDLPNDEIHYLATTLRPIEIPAGTLLSQEGSRGDHFYVVTDGQLEIIKALGTREERILAIRGPGEFIGEMSLFLRNGKRTASVRAVCDTRLLEMARTDFDELLDRRPQLAYELVRVLSLRLRESQDETIRDLKEKNRQLALAYEQLKAAQEQLIEKEKIEHELQVANNIQMSILPAELPKVPGFDLGALMEPAHMVGGDFFDIFHLGGEKLGVVIGDVTDKGVPAALYMAETHALIIAEASHGSSPVETLLRVNRHLLRTDDSSLFVTVLYGILDCNTGRFEYARAGHELPLAISPDCEIIELRMDVGIPLGIQDEPTLDKQVLGIAHGSTLLLYTDGITDSIDSKEDYSALDKFKRILSQIVIQGGDAQFMCNQLLHSSISSCQNISQVDDITLVALKRHAIRK